MLRRSAPTLAELQAAMQAAILAGDAAPALPLVRRGAHAPRETLLGVYTAAYTLRLVGVLKADFPLTAVYLGNATFDRAARSYIAAHPSPHHNARWVGDRFAAHLASDGELASHPQVSELAALEWALGLAFDAPDAPHLSLADLAAIPTDGWSEVTLVPHPSAAVITETWSAFDIWSALKEEAEPPEARPHADPAALFIWRHDATPAVRRLEPEEAMLWRETARGTAFGRLCELSAVYDDPATAALRVASYVRGWLDTGALSAFAFRGLPEGCIREPALL